MRKWLEWSGLSVLSLFSVASFGALPVQSAHTSVELLSEFESVAPNSTQWVGLHFQPEAGWHVYWKNPGDSGLAPKSEFSSAPNGSRFGGLEFPTPERIPYGPLVNYAYPGEVLYPIQWTAPESLQPGESITLTATAKWLVCKEECVPGKAVLTLTLPVEPKEKFGTSSGTHAKLFKATVSSLPTRADDRVKVSQKKDRFEIDYLGKVSGSLSEIFFFPDSGMSIPSATKETVTRIPGGVRIRFIRAESAVPEAALVRGLLKTSEHSGIAIGPKTALVPVSSTTSSAPLDSATLKDSNELKSVLTAVNPTGEEENLGIMLIFAFIGGIILNLMPCILPVLSIKVVEIATQSGTQKSAIRKHGIIFTLGVLVSFWVLAIILLTLRAGGTTLGWGFQLQSPFFIAALAILFFLMAMNLFGFFEVGDRLMGVGGGLTRKEGYVGSFFTGVLTTVAATPCSAPFMGTALGFALTQGAFSAVLVLTVLGLGLAFPYLVFSFLPNASKILPRPGMWMKSLKEFLAFPLLGTVVWLCGVLGNQAGILGVVRLLTAIVLVVGIIWIYGHRADRALSKFARTVFIAGLAVFAFAALSPLGELQHERSTRKVVMSALVVEPWKAWSASALQTALDAKKTVLVNFTADWCVTCKVNEKLVFERESVKEAMRAPGVVALLGDWTNGDPEMTAALMKVGRNSVPVYLVYKKGSPEPKILPQLLSADGLISELR
ncbi:MAG: thioredoxin family protein [Cryobacterium sp.]|nr:thioredoxin family protein [Oligoflexia bacterium]